LKAYANELLDPEASFRRAFAHSALALLKLVAEKLEPADAQKLATWANADLRDWRILGHETSDPPYPPSRPGHRVA
jgi:hypothetical protein